MMGQGEPLLNLAERDQGDAAADSIPNGIGAVAAADHAFDLGHHSEDRGTGARAGAAEAGDFAECVDRGDSGSELMPITRKYHLKDLMAACRRIRCGRGRS